jgi:hypothetical protein
MRASRTVALVAALCGVLAYAAAVANAVSGRSPRESSPVGSSASAAPLFQDSVNANNICTDNVCDLEAVGAPGIDIGQPVSGPVSVTMTSFLNSGESGCTSPGQGGPWDVQWWEDPVGSKSNVPGPGWRKRADFGSMRPGSKVQRTLNGVIENSNFNPVILWTGHHNVQCGVFQYVGRVACPSPSVTAHATRSGNPGTVDVALAIRRRSAAASSCRLSARLNGRRVHLTALGSNAIASVRLSSRNAVCTDSELLSVSDGTTSLRRNVNVPGDHLAFATAHAVRQANGTIVATARVKGLLPTAKCSRPDLTVTDALGAFTMHLTQISSPNASTGSATAVRTVPASSTVCTGALQYAVTQTQATARAVRTVTGAPCKLMPKGP